MQTNLALTKAQPDLILHPTIKSTGMRGFVQWLQSDPVLSKTVFPKIRDQLAALIQKEGGMAGLAGSYSEDMFGGPGGLYGLGRFGQDDGTLTDILATPAGTWTPGVTDTLSPVQLSTNTMMTTPATIAATPQAPASPSWSSSVSSLISGIGAGLMSAEQLVTTNKVVNAQLAQAQAGRPPLNLSSYGLSTTPGLNLGLSSGTENMVLLLGGGLVLALILGSVLKSRR